MTQKFEGKQIQRDRNALTMERMESIKAGCGRLGVAVPVVKTRFDAVAVLDDLCYRESKQRRKLSIEKQLRLIEERRRNAQRPYRA